MKRGRLLFVALYFVFSLFFSSDANAVMDDYCVVPPYVIQDVAPNVMFLVDNSGSMFNFAYQCVQTVTTAAEASFDSHPVPVASVAGFNVGDKIAVWDNLHGAGGDYWNGFGPPSYAAQEITSIDRTNNILNVSGPLHFSAGAAVVKRNCTYLPGYTDSAWYDTFNPAITDYYGYFKSQYWYTSSAIGFDPTAPKLGTGLSGERAKNSTEWDGNFLNWLTMRRNDVVRRVLTGGAFTGSGSNKRLKAELADCNDRGTGRRVPNAELYSAVTGSAQERCFWVNTAARASCDGGGNGTTSFKVSSDSTCASYGSNYTVAVKTGATIEGVLQDVVSTKARVGLTFYNVSTGGDVRVPIGGGSLSSTINEINISRPNSNTPLAEALWTVIGYYAQDVSIDVDGDGSADAPNPVVSAGKLNTNNDPLNYNQGGGQPRYPPCAKSYVLILTDGEPCADGNLPPELLDYANVASPPESPTWLPYNCGTPLATDQCPTRSCDDCIAATLPSCSAGGDVAGIEDVALFAHTTDLRSSTNGVSNITGTQNLDIFTVFAFGKGSTLLRYAAINGGFEDANGNNQPDLQTEWDNNSDGEPDNYYEADSGQELEDAIRNALSTILKRASSGTAASVLASGEGSGANLVQAVFYPRRRFGNEIINWTGENQNFWYYIDPFFLNSSIREDTVSDKTLNLVEDYVASFYFDNAAQITKARRFQDADGDGSGDAEVTPPIVFEDLKSIWKAGDLLWSRDISTTPRTIYTPCLSGGTCIGTTGLMDFSTAEKITLRPYLQATDDTDSEYIIRYLHGEGLTTLDLNSDGVIVPADGDIAGIDRNADSADDFRPRYATIGPDTHVWKLGDVLNSTPRIASRIALGNFDTKYDDTSYAAFVGSHTNPTDYQNRGMVFAGANDGMLHAFKLGRLELKSFQDNTCTFGSFEEACLSGTDAGKEEWAYIPKQALPYMKYFTDPAYCHIFSVDLSPYIFDASIGDVATDISANPRASDGSTWRTIVIGGMRYGGACRNTGAACNSNSCSVTTTKACTTDANCPSGETCVPNCVRTPITDPADATKGLGYSSYFALDVTDNLAHPGDTINHPPKLLWEFSDPELGFSTTGPAIVRIGDRALNGKWFVVFGSGPTGPIQTRDHQFVGHSDQDLRFFVLDLKTGALSRKFTAADVGIPFAFAGSMINTTIDVDMDYQDDAVYVGYVKRTGSSPNYSWTDGGVGRIFTKESTNVNQWVWNGVVDGIGPVTSSISKLQNNKYHNLFLYFGTGRYFFEILTNVDDPLSQRRIFGVKDPCFTSSNAFDTACTSTVSVSSSACTASWTGAVCNVTNVASAPTETSANAAGFTGWYVNLDLSGNYTYTEGGTPVPRAYRAERVITDPLSTSTGLIFFTTYKPYNDECGLGGKSFIWSLRYNTGGAPGARLKGVALLQVSTGSIEQLDLSSAFNEAGGRKTSALEGVPPTQQGLSLLSTPPPLKKVIHLREK